MARARRRFAPPRCRARGRGECGWRLRGRLRVSDAIGWRERGQWVRWVTAPARLRSTSRAPSSIGARSNASSARRESSSIIDSTRSRAPQRCVRRAPTRARRPARARLQPRRVAARARRRGLDAAEARGARCRLVALHALRREEPDSIAGVGEGQPAARPGLRARAGERHAQGPRAGEPQRAAGRAARTYERAGSCVRRCARGEGKPRSAALPAQGPRRRDLQRQGPALCQLQERQRERVPGAPRGRRHADRGRQPDRQRPLPPAEGRGLLERAGLPVASPGGDLCSGDPGQVADVVHRIIRQYARISPADR